jgi:hypothetical protein
MREVVKRKGELNDMREEPCRLRNHRRPSWTRAVCSRSGSTLAHRQLGREAMRPWRRLTAVPDSRRKGGRVRGVDRGLAIVNIGTKVRERKDKDAAVQVGFTHIHTCMHTYIHTHLAIPGCPLTQRKSRALTLRTPTVFPAPPSTCLR